MRTKDTHLMIVISGTIGLVTCLVLLFWKAEEVYFPSISPMISNISAILIASFIFSFCAHFLFRKTLKSFVNETQKEIVNVNVLKEKIANLEERIVALKNENEMLKDRGPVHKETKQTENGIPIKNSDKYVPNEKLNLIMHERMFIHDLANKVQILKAATSSVSEMIESIEHKESKQIIRQIELISSNIEKMSKLLTENREYLIIAS